MIISPSILNADYLNLEKEIRFVEQVSADAIHLDIMDGRFVQPTTWGASTVSAIREVTGLPLEVHLMVEEPERKIEEYIDAGADYIFIHPESTVYLRRILRMLKQSNVKAGVALKLETPIHVLEHCFDLVDTVLFVTSEEGFGGQPFHPLALKKISDLKELRDLHEYRFEIEVDGGIGIDTGKKCKAAGADRFVIGSFLFNHPNRSEAIQMFRNI